MKKDFNKNEKKSSNEDSLSLGIFYKDIRKFKLLPSDEQVNLAALAKGGDKKAEKKLIESNQRFIVSIAKEYRNLGLEIDDLINEGNIGLMRAIQKYDETRGIKFLSYAVWWIRQAMLQSIYETADIVRFPVNKINILNKINKIKDQLSQQFNREPTIDEICENTDLKEEEIITVYDGNTTLSIDQKISEDSDSCLLDFISNEDYSNMESKINKESLNGEINKIFSSLTEREIDIMNMYFGLNGSQEMTLKEIGEELNLTNERVRQIKENATKKLRSHSKLSKLKDFLNERTFKS